MINLYERLEFLIPYLALVLMTMATIDLVSVLTTNRVFPLWVYTPFIAIFAFFTVGNILKQQEMIRDD